MAFNSDRIRKYIPRGDGYNSEFAIDLTDGANEIDRLINVAQQGHDRLLRGDSDAELLELLQTAWD